jgi:hypothetical protein
MKSGPYRKLYVLALTALLVCLAAPAWPDGFPGGMHEVFGPYHELGPHLVRPMTIHVQPGLDIVRRWNQIAITAVGIDHTPGAPGTPHIYGEQLGPHRTSRALAIVHIAIFDAVNAITGGYESYTDLPPVPRGTSLQAAVAQAAHDTLVELYTSQAPSFDMLLDEDLSHVRDNEAKAHGINLGARAAAAILALRANDGSHYTEPVIGVDYIPIDKPGKWQQDPISQGPLALGAYWYRVRPFVLKSATQYYVPPPPPLWSREYAAAFNEVKQLGGDGIVTPTVRTPEQTIIGMYWAYDGTPLLGTPPRLYNQITVRIADQMHTDGVHLARLLALINTGMADAGISCWAWKYYYDFWRPVTGIREADTDRNPYTKQDTTFTPLGAQASNTMGPNFTPPFPAYTSGHATFGGTIFQILRQFYGTDQIAFTAVSDEFNGQTRDNHGNVRPLIPRHFSSLSQAEEENGQSRIYLGIHWAFDKTEGIYQGRLIGDYVFDHAFGPERPHGR